MILNGNRIRYMKQCRFLRKIVCKNKMQYIRKI